MKKLKVKLSSDRYKPIYQQHYNLPLSNSHHHFPPTPIYMQQGITNIGQSDIGLKWCSYLIDPRLILASFAQCVPGISKPHRCWITLIIVELYHNPASAFQISRYATHYMGHTFLWPFKSFADSLGSCCNRYTHIRVYNVPRDIRYPKVNTEYATLASYIYNSVGAFSLKDVYWLKKMRQCHFLRMAGPGSVTTATIFDDVYTFSTHRLHRYLSIHDSVPLLNMMMVFPGLVFPF